MTFNETMVRVRSSRTHFANACADLLGRGRPFRKTSVMLDSGRKEDKRAVNPAPAWRLSACRAYITIQMADPPLARPPSRSAQVGEALVPAATSFRASISPAAMARSKARSAAAPTELQPYHDTASGTNSHSPGAVAIGRNTPGVSLCSCAGAGYIDSRCRLIGLSEAFGSRRRGRLSLRLRRRFGN